MANPRLIFISHAHSPPLNPPGDLKYNLRPLPNPPKHIRDLHDGTSRRLQEWMRAELQFNALIEKAVQEIKIEIESFREKLAAKPDGGGSVTAHTIQTTEDTPCKDEDSGLPATDDRAHDLSSSDWVLTIDVSCEMGRHRSVAFVEELASSNWPEGWDVSVIHRDVDRKRKRDSRRPNGRRYKGGFIDVTNDD